jgi:hypothetical protein
MVSPRFSAVLEEILEKNLKFFGFFLEFLENTIEQKNAPLRKEYLPNLLEN